MVYKVATEGRLVASLFFPIRTSQPDNDIYLFKVIFPLHLVYFMSFEIICVTSTCKWPARSRRNQSAASYLNTVLKANGWGVTGYKWQKLDWKTRLFSILLSQVCIKLSANHQNPSKNHICIYNSQVHTNFWDVWANPVTRILWIEDKKTVPNGIFLFRLCSKIEKLNETYLEVEVWL